MGETKLARPNNKTVYSMALTEEQEYEREYWEREERFLKMKLQAVQSIADSINNLAKATEMQAQQTIVVLNVNTPTSESDVSHIQQMIEALKIQK